MSSKVYAFRKVRRQGNGTFLNPRLQYYDSRQQGLLAGAVAIVVQQFHKRNILLSSLHANSTQFLNYITHMTAYNIS